MSLHCLRAAANRVGSIVIALCLVVSLGSPALAGPVGAVGDVYVGDGDGLGIFQFDGATGAPAGVFTPYSGPGILGMDWGPDGNLYAVVQRSLSRWDVAKIDGNTGVRIGNVLSYNNPSVFSVAKGIAFGPDGDLYLGDWFQARIDRYDGDSFALKASYQAVSGDGLGTPNYMTFAPNGSLMVVSGGFNRVLEFSTAGNGIGLVGTFANLVNAQQPQDLAFGPNGNLFVSAGYTGNVEEFDGVTGAYLGDFVPADAGRSAIGLCFDDYGRMLLAAAGTGGYKVLAYDSATGDPLGDFIPEGSGGLSSPIYLSIKPVPEPATFALLLFAGAALGCRRSRSA